MVTQFFALAPLTQTSILSFVVLLLGLVGILWMVWAKPMPKVAKSASLGILLVMLSGFAWVFYQSSRAEIELTENELKLDIPFYKVQLARTDLLIDQARIVDLKQDAGLKPSFKTNGIGMPGFKLGWFNLHNKGKAFVALTDRAELVLLPTTKGYSLLLSVPEGKRFIEQLQK
ncbi:PH domain-containing protein [Shewanella acanthi]|uniref:PH domain-containing protein n=1 Tax=Shewanella acanthi TaxID=2864212 RepID=UPI001C6567A8|nr:PH domain-containing protein [Shewanella acanthi]QYJ78557.1 PH domain-containing protein [Shewanella acanthi]